jgi:hypothetical protein
VGFCHDNKSERVTFDKQEKDAVLLYYLWSNDTQHHYDKEPLQKQCCTDSGIQSNFIFTSEKTNGCQQLTHSANSEGGRLASSLLSGRKSVGIQPTSLHLTNKSRQSPSFFDDVSIDSWQCQMEIDTVKSKITESEPIASRSTIQMEPNISHSTNQIKRNESSATFKLVVASVSKKYALSFVDKSSATLKLVVASVTNKDLKGSTNGSLARFEHLPVGATVAPTFFNGQITSIFQLVVAFVANKYKHDGIYQHPSEENGLH